MKKIENIQALDFVPELPNIIIIGVDGLRPDMMSAGLEISHESYLGKFLSEAKVYKHVTSPIARTFPAFISILRGETCSEHGVRFNLTEKTLDTAKIFENSYVDKFQQLGYKTALYFDSVDYLQFQKNKFIDVLQTPKTGAYNLILPLFFRSRIFLAFFNNYLGRMIAPEFIGNDSFFLSSLPYFFKNDLIGGFKKMAKFKKPFFMTTHTAKLHWPGSRPYPYYLLAPKEISEFGAYSFSRQTIPLQGAYNSLPRLEYNFELYKIGVQQIINEHLEPVVQYLTESQLLENSIVIILSDHGEYFSKDGIFPENKIPSHGSSLLNGDDSNQSFLAIRFPTNKRHVEIFKNEEERVGLVQLLPNIFNFIINKKIDSSKKEYAKNVFATETGDWISNIVPYQNFTNFNASMKSFYINDQSQVVMTSVYEQMYHFQKQRAIEFGQSRLVVFPTQFGYQIKLFQKNNNGAFEELALTNNEHLFKNLWEYFKNIYAKDFENEFMPHINIDQSTLDSGRMTWDIDKYYKKFKIQRFSWRSDWIMLQGISELLYYDMNFKKAYEITMYLIKSPEVSEFIKMQLIHKFIIFSKWLFSEELMSEIDIFFSKLPILASEDLYIRNEMISVIVKDINNSNQLSQNNKINYFKDKILKKTIVPIVNEKRAAAINESIKYAFLEEFKKELEAISRKQSVQTVVESNNFDKLFEYEDSLLKTGYWGAEQKFFNLLTAVIEKSGDDQIQGRFVNLWLGSERLSPDTIFYLKEKIGLERLKNLATKNTQNTCSLDSLNGRASLVAGLRCIYKKIYKNESGF